MNIKLLVFVLLVLSFGSANAQVFDTLNSAKNKNSVFVEVFGGPAAYSINYQHIASSTTKLAFTYRVGTSFLPNYQTITGYIGGVTMTSNRAFEFLMGLGYYRSKDDSKSTFLGDAPERNDLYVSPQIGYRSQKLSNGLLFRATLTPWLTVNNGLGKVRFTPGFGLSLGKAF